ncbi:MAG: hypothetical protein JJU02_01170 [Cryomorphaceae bacterium]|nr:hypothetical protein [Cryomorphaceae bacterium]
MKKFILPVIALSLIAAGCNRDKDDEGPGRPKDPIDKVSTEPITYGAIINVGDILSKSINAEIAHRFANLEEIENHFLIHIPGEGDAFYDPDHNFIHNVLPALAGPLDFYMNSNVFELDPDREFLDMFPPFEPPVASVNHIHKTQGDSVIVNARVEFFKNSIGKNYFVASYLLAEFQAVRHDMGPSFMAPPFPGRNSNLNDETVFTMDFPNDSVTIFSDGEKYAHRHVLIGEPNFPLGVSLDSVNIFGKEYEMGDVYGTKEMPIRMALPKTHVHNEYASGYALWTVLYELETEIDPADPDGPPLVFISILNSYKSKI